MNPLFLFNASDEITSGIVQASDPNLVTDGNGIGIFGWLVAIGFVLSIVLAIIAIRAIRNMDFDISPNNKMLAQIIAELENR